MNLTGPNGLERLARLLNSLPAAYLVWLAAEDACQEPELVLSRQRLRLFLDQIHELADSTLRRFAGESLPLAKSIRLAVRVSGLLKGAIANQPGLALLPAPSDQSIKRWQRLVHEPHDAGEAGPELFTLEPPRPADSKRSVSHQFEDPPPVDRRATSIQPDSDYSDWLASKLSLRTRRAYRADMEHFVRFAGLDSPEDLMTIGPGTLTTYRNSMEATGMKPSTVARRLSTMRSFLNYLVTLGRIDRSPADPLLVPSPRVSKEGTTPGLSDREARALLRAPDTSTRKGRRDKAILAVGLYQWLRREEIANLNIGSIGQDLGHHTMLVQGKGGRTRLLPIHPVALAAIQQYLAAEGRLSDPEDTPLFTSLGHAAEPGTRLGPDDVWDIVKHYAAEAGIAKISPHAMRVTGITSSLDHGGTIARVQAAAGHADPKTTVRYYRHADELDHSPIYATKY